MKAMHTHSIKKLSAWIMTLILCLLSAPSAAPAQDDHAPIPAQAQTLFDDAVADYMAKRWDQAALKFRKAYAVLPDALFLYNLAKALQKLENYEAALGALKRARDQEERPLPPDIVAKVPAFLAELEVSLAAQQEAQQEAKEEEKAVDIDVVASTDPPPQQKEGLGTLGWVGIGGLVAGSGLMVFGGILASEVSKEVDRVKTEPGQTPEQFQADRDAVQGEQRTAQIVFYSGMGVALLGAGLVGWTLFSTKKEGASEEPRARLKLGVTHVAWEATW